MFLGAVEVVVVAGAMTRASTDRSLTLSRVAAVMQSPLVSRATCCSRMESKEQVDLMIACK